MVALKFVPLCLTFACFLSLPASLIAAGPPLQLEVSNGFPKAHRDERVVIKGFSPRYKLPEKVIPVQYDISLITILDDEVVGRDKWTAVGSVRIYLDCKEATSQIIIHKSPDLVISHPTISVLTDDSVPITVLPDFTFDPVKEFYEINLGSELVAGQEYSIYIEFVAQIYSEDVRLEGMYRSSYTNANGVKSYIATTQFEPTDFRRLVPSFDEPHLKATFNIRIGRAAKYQSLCNSEFHDELPDGMPNPMPIDAEGFEGWFWDIYKETVPMSTYLVAIIVTEDYSHVEAPAGIYNKPVKIYGPTELIERGGGDFAAETAARQLAYFETHFEVPYAMHKMDSIAIPDFSAGAMENWGLNTYRIPYLLHFAGETTESERGLISNILAHELGHQWFGNPVTCATWPNLWLNEGFATYVSYLGWEHTHPEFDAIKFFMNDAFQYAMIRDANPATTHPMINDAVTTDEINSYFTPITYERGGSIIRMMEAFLGPETLRKGLVRYLNDMNFKGAVQDDLWRNLNIQAVEDGVLPEGATMKNIMDTWTLQAGFPIIRVSAATSTRIFVSQERVANGLPSTGDLDPNNLWYVPVGIAQADDDQWDTKPKFWIEPHIALRSFTSVDTTKWIVINPSATGYYRVLYDTELTNLILEQLEANHNAFTPESRSQFIDDHFTLGFSRHIRIENALEFTKYLGNERDRIVWGAALASLRNSFNKLRGTAAFDEFKKYLNPRLLSTLNAIGFEQESAHIGSNVMLRATLLDWACAMKLPECIAYSNRLYVGWQSGTPVPVDLRTVMYCAIVANEDSLAFNFVFGQYQALTPSSTSGNQQTRLIGGLACSSTEADIQSLLGEVVKGDDSLLKSAADKRTTLVRLAGNTNAQDLVLDLLDANIAQLKSVDGLISVTMNALVANMGTAADYLKILAFAEAHQADLEEIEIDPSVYLNTINNNIAWKAEYEDTLETWFKSNNSP